MPNPERGRGPYYLRRAPPPPLLLGAYARLAAAQGCPRTIPTLLAVHPDEGTPRADFCRHRTESPTFADRSLLPLLIRHVEIPGRRPANAHCRAGSKTFPKNRKRFQFLRSPAF